LRWPEEIAPGATATIDHIGAIPAGRARISAI